jgi:hypothetical protein
MIRHRMLPKNHNYLPPNQYIRTPENSRGQTAFRKIQYTRLRLRSFFPCSREYS